MALILSDETWLSSQSGGWKSPFLDPEDSEQKQCVSELNLSLKETVPAVCEQGQPCPAQEESWVNRMNT